MISLTHEQFDGSALGRIAILVILGIAFEILTLRLDSLRRRLSPGLIADMGSVWTFAAALALPPGQASVVLGLLGLWQWYGRPTRSRGFAYRRVVTWAAALLAVQSASGLVRHFGPTLNSLPTGLDVTLTVVAALASYFVVDTVLLFGVRYLAIRPAALRGILGSGEDAALEIATLCLGGLAGAALLHEFWLVLLVLPPMAVLQRSALVKQLREAATTDAKTGLLNAGAWEQIAQRELIRAEREQTGAAVLILDLDFFKNVNDRHGHLAGDAALVEVARCLLHELRPYDVVGRFGGEEFVALLPDIDVGAATRAAERVRTRIASLPVPPVVERSGGDASGPSADNTGRGLLFDGEAGNPITLSASIGVSVFPAHGLDLPTLLHRADAALYGAKRGGRNRVVVAGTEGTGPMSEIAPVQPA